MEKIVNKPVANTFGWLHVNGTKVCAPDSVNKKELTVFAGETRTVVADSGETASQTMVSIEKNATLRYVQIRRRGECELLLNDIRVRCSENARFEYYRIVLGGAETYDNVSVTLEGDGSSFLCEVGYRLNGEEKLDMNYEAIHTGKKTNSAINVSGVLSDHAFKLLRGTIDLRRGCKGAVGNETEDVLLMDPTVRNQTVPVILCGEEDVVGNHGATIGRLNENILFYLESRGMEPGAVYEMLARARVDAVIRKIPDAATATALLPETEDEA